jgi:uncharacterized membrane protein YqiK
VLASTGTTVLLVLVAIAVVVVLVVLWRVWVADRTVRRIRIGLFYERDRLGDDELELDEPRARRARGAGASAYDPPGTGGEAGTPARR